MAGAEQWVAPVPSKGVSTVPRRVILACAVGMLALANSHAYGGIDPVATCRMRKATATGRAAADLLRAFAKNQKRPDVGKLTQNISRAQSKFLSRFSNAERQTSCPPAAASTLAEKVDTFLAEVISWVCINCTCCGNGVIDPTEECDLGTELNGPPPCSADCKTIGACTGSGDICRDASECPPGEGCCGDGIVDAGEECDPPDVPASWCPDPVFMGCVPPGRPDQCQCCAGDFQFCGDLPGWTVPCCNPTSRCYRLGTHVHECRPADSCLEFGVWCDFSIDCCDGLACLPGPGGFSYCCFPPSCPP